MLTSYRSSSSAVREHVSAACARRALAAALIAACAASPLQAIAQRDSASSPSTAKSGQQRKSVGAIGNDDAKLPAATRRAREDEQRLLGSPGATFNPYANDGSSPTSQEDALMSEQRMKVIKPSDFYRSGSPAIDTGGKGRGKRSSGVADASGGGPAPTTGSSAGGNAAAGAAANGMTAAQDRYSGSASTASSIYRDPYQSQSAYSGQPYRSPW
jgi:hypothetical protein